MSEPVFLSRPSPDSEDDGYILAHLYHPILHTTGLEKRIRICSSLMPSGVAHCTLATTIPSAVCPTVAALSARLAPYLVHREASFPCHSYLLLHLLVYH